MNDDINHNDKISSQSFFQVWLETVHNEKEHLLKIWRNNSAFTSAVVKGGEASIIKKVADKLELLCYCADYYSLDAILYKKEDLVPGLAEGQYWFRDIRVAFEHENFVNSGLHHEVSHLLITNCDLKVLVTYPNDDAKKHLDDLHRIIQGNRQSQTLSDDESFLIILGYEGDFSWDGYSFKQSAWKKLQ